MLGNVGYRNFPTAFSPAALFAASEPGVWFDPSDVANTNWLYNLLTFTEQFDNAAWTKSAITITSNAITAPDGTITADKLIPSIASSTHSVGQNLTVPTATTYTGSVYAKAGEYNFASILLLTTFAAAQVLICNLTTGTITFTSGSPLATSITSVGNGWYRISITQITNAAGTATMEVRPSNSGTTTFFAGDGTSGIYTWGAQFEVSATATTYQPITTVNAGTIARYPLATLYQDSAGTTPVTAPNQPVGLMLSKDKGLVLGSELKGTGTVSTLGSPGTLGTYNTSTGAGSAYRLDGSNASGVQISPTQDTTYVIDVEQLTGSLQIRGTTLTGTQLVSSVTGRQTFIVFLPSGSYLYFTSGANAASTTFTIFSVKALPGNHATQSTSGSRPTYGIVPATGRRNLLTYSEQFDNAAWAKSNLNVAADVFTAPDGTLTADRFTATATTSNHRVTSTTITLASGQNCVQSVYIKAGTHSFVQIHDGTSTSYFANFNVSTGVVGTATGCTAVMTNVGSGWYRCSIAMALNAANPIMCIGLVTSNTAARNESWAANGTETIQVWGAQLEVNTTATAYQRVVTAFEVTEANVASLSYLGFDGVDDSMVTPTITPGTDKVQVFAGVRKLSDATTGMVIEASTALSSNLGAFFLAAPNGAASNYSFVSKGSIPTFGSDGLANGFAAPTTNVVTGLGDISGNSVIIRVNATQRAIATTVQGTGNYLAYPLYLGRRGGTTLPFNGQMYGLITRFGANLTTTAISRTESWLNNKTGAF